MSDKNTLGIFEAGISQPDEMERLQPIIAPTIGVITNIGEAHQENFISSTQKCLEKLTLFNDCEAIIYDGDDALSPTASSRPACPTKQSLGVGQTRKPLCISNRSRNWIPKPLSAARF